MKMNLKIWAAITCCTLAFVLFCGKESGSVPSSAPGPTEVTVENVETLNVGGGNDGGTHGCPKDVQKDYGLFEFGGHKGPLCKPAITTKITKDKCKIKGLTSVRNLCVMEWESNGGFFRVRLLK